MPSSDPENIPRLIEVIRRRAPSSVLDVGIGTGKIGLFVRDYLDGHWTGRAFHDPTRWEVRLVGVEIFPEYITPLHEWLYDKIVLGDIRDHSILLQRYDMIVMGDVIEHMSKADGISLLKIFAEDNLEPGGCVLISTPIFPTASLRDRKPHHAVFGNENELHESLWSPADFENVAGFKSNVQAGDVLYTVEMVLI